MVSQLFEAFIDINCALPDHSLETPSSAYCHVHDREVYHRPAALDAPVDNIRLMKTWLHNCQRNHKDCLVVPRRFLPTRLIDVQAFRDCSDVRLIDTEPLKIACDKACKPYPEYLALSHCWGPRNKQPVTTKNRNLKSRKSRIRARDLSRTFLDAVVVARKLGQQYLWIDSLCIIQNDKDDPSDDWVKEAALMADVYGNAYCTLSALSSEDGTQGCHMTDDLRRSTGNSYYEFQVHRQTQTYVRLFRRPPAIWSEEYGEEATDPGPNGVRNPLRYRAWTLQEAELSRRTIFFADRQLLWRCRNLRGTTELPWTEQLPDVGHRMKPWPLCDGLQDDQTEGIFSDTRLKWYRLVEDYSLRKLTYDSDKLTAIAGLAKDYQRMFPGAQYVAGMWGPHTPRMPIFRPSHNPRLKNDLRHQLHAGAIAIGAHCSATLLWRSMDQGARRYGEYRAPTWSWASIDGRISYDSQRVEPHGNSFDRMGVREELSDCDFGGMQWNGMIAEASKGDRYGAVHKGARLSLKGALLARCSVTGKPSTGFFEQTPRPRTRQDSFLRNVTKTLSKIPSIRAPEKDESDIEGEPLWIAGRVVGVFFRDSADDAPPSDDEIFCLRIRGEPLFGVTRHVFKAQQETEDIGMIMGIVVVRTRCRTLGETYKRVGLARWVNAALFQRSLPANIELV